MASREDITDGEVSFVLACMTEMARVSDRLRRELVRTGGDEGRAIAVLSLSHLAFAAGFYASADGATPERFGRAAAEVADGMDGDIGEHVAAAVPTRPVIEVVYYGRRRRATRPSFTSR